jgi:heparan-alpha-glucosaminide N-acetyltransferase
MTESAKEKIQRYLALDAYRGFIMLLLASHAFGFGKLQGDPTWGTIAAWFEHKPWEWITLWDLIQPGFMYIVGVAMPFALAIRAQKGATFSDNTKHVAIRALKLIFLAQLLSMGGSGDYRFQMINVLCQIALTYFLVYWIMQWPLRWQVVTAVALLVFHTALFHLFPGPDGPYSREGNIGQVLDKAIMGYNYSGLWVGLNFVTSTVTTLFGAWTGMLLMRNKDHRYVVKMLALGMGGAFVLGLAISPWNPIVKRICTASFTLYSTGWVLLGMLIFYLVVEVKNIRKWTYPLVVIGANSIFIYAGSGWILRGWLERVVGVMTGDFLFIGTLAPVAKAVAVLAVMYYMNWWLYKRKIFFKV